MKNNDEFHTEKVWLLALSYIFFKLFYYILKFFSPSVEVSLESKYISHFSRQRAIFTLVFEIRIENFIEEVWIIKDKSRNEHLDQIFHNRPR